MASLSDVIIFLFLGIVTIEKQHNFHFEFTFWTVVLCIVIRFFCIYIMSAGLNRRRMTPISKKEQFIMAYGGLRGAVGFSLVTILDDSNELKEIFQTTTLIMIFITVFIMGSTVKPLVKILNIKKSDKTERLIAEDVNDKCIDLLMCGVESVVGRKMSRYQFLNSIVNFDRAYLKKHLIVEGAEDPLTLKMQQISLDEHYARLYGPAILVAENKVQDMLGDENISRKNSKSEENDRKILEKGFASNSFQKWIMYKRVASDVENENKIEMEENVNRKTSILWNLALKNANGEAAETIGTAGPSFEQISEQNNGVGERTELIKQAYRKSKLRFKSE